MNNDSIKLSKERHDDVAWLTAKQKETRVKYHNSYRLKITKEYEDFRRNKDENKKLEFFEKKITKINPNLIIEEKEHNNIFIDGAVSTTNDYSYIEDAKTILTRLESKKLNEIMYKYNINDNVFQKDPSFDKYGKLSLEWLKDDYKFKDLSEMQNWNNWAIENWDKINDKLKEKSRLFNTTLEKCNNKEEKREIEIPKSKNIPIYINAKLKFVFWILFWSFCFIVVTITILMILIFAGV